MSRSPLPFTVRSIVESHQWAELLNNEATLYDLTDAAIALVGDHDDVASDAVPVMILRSVHCESGIEMSFTYRIPHDLIQVFGGVFSRMAHDIENDSRLDQTNEGE